MIMPLIILVIDIDRETRERPHLWLALRGGSCGKKTRAAAGPKRRSGGRAAVTDAASRRGRRRTRDRGRGHGVQHDEGASNMTAVSASHSQCDPQPVGQKTGLSSLYGRV